MASESRRPLCIRLSQEEIDLVIAWGEKRAKDRSDLRTLGGGINVSATIRAMIREVSR